MNEENGKVKIPLWVKKIMDEYATLQDLLWNEFYRGYENCDGTPMTRIGVWLTETSFGEENFERLCKAWGGNYEIQEEAFVVSLGDMLFMRWLDSEERCPCFITDIAPLDYLKAKRYDSIDAARVDASRIQGAYIIEVTEKEIVEGYGDILHKLNLSMSLREREPYSLKKRG